MEMHYTATALILDDQHRVLLLFHHKFGRWMCPGGHIEPGETPDDAVLREVLEETGLHARLISPVPPVRDVHAFALATPLCILHEWITEQHVHIDLVYRCAVVPGQCLRVNPAEAREARWFAAEEVLGWGDAETYANIRQVLRYGLEAEGVDPRSKENP